MDSLGIPEGFLARIPEGFPGGEWDYQFTIHALIISIAFVGGWGEAVLGDNGYMLRTQAPNESPMQVPFSAKRTPPATTQPPPVPGNIATSTPSRSALCVVRTVIMSVVPLWGVCRFVALCPCRRWSKMSRDVM